MTVRIDDIDETGLATVLDDVVALYRAVFAHPPYRETAGDVGLFAARLPRYAMRLGLRCRVATEDDTLVQFAYGHASRPGQRRHDVVGAGPDAGTAERWHDDAFELVNLAGMPATRGRGIGGRLPDVVLGDLPCRTAVLVTAKEQTPAAHLYRARGRVVVRDDFRFPELPLPYRIIGLNLPSATG